MTNKTIMTKEKFVTWNEFHKGYELSDDINSPWHIFLKENIDSKRDVFGKELLEIGCGRGGMSNYISSLGPSTLYACDYSSEAVAMGRERYGEGEHMKWQTEDIQKLSFSDDHFDTIVSCETIEHIPDIKKALSELYRVLKPGGRMYLTCPNYFNLVGIWCIYRKMIGNPYTEGGQPYVRYLLLPILVNWLKSAGFRINYLDTGGLVLPKAPYIFFNNKSPRAFKYFGLYSFFILTKPIMTEAKR